MSANDVVYPLWAILCDDCDYVGALWEKPGTGCAYVEHCPSCGRGPVGVRTRELNSLAEHKQAQIHGVSDAA